MTEIQPAASPPGLWKTKKVAEFLDFTPQYVRMLERSGRLPKALKIGAREKRWHAAEIIAFAQAQAQANAA